MLFLLPCAFVMVVETASKSKCLVRSTFSHQQLARYGAFLISYIALLYFIFT